MGGGSGCTPVSDADAASPDLPPNRTLDGHLDFHSTVVSGMSGSDDMAVDSGDEPPWEPPKLQNLVERDLPPAYRDDDTEYTVVRKRPGRELSGTPGKHKKI